MSKVIKNDGVAVFLPKEANGLQITLPFKGEAQILNIVIGWFGNNTLLVTHDMRVELMGRLPSDPLSEKELVALTEHLGLEFELDNPKDRVQPYPSHWREIMAIAGYGEKAINWEVKDGLAFKVSYPGRRLAGIGPYRFREVKKRANKLIGKARRYLHAAFPALMRHLKQLDEFQLVEFYQRVASANVLRTTGGTITIDRKTGGGNGSLLWRSHGQDPVTKMIYGGNYGSTEQVIIYGEADFSQTPEQITICFQGPGAVLHRYGNDRVFPGLARWTLHVTE